MSIILNLYFLYNYLIPILNSFNLVLYTKYLVIHLYLFSYIKFMNNSMIVITNKLVMSISNIRILIILYTKFHLIVINFQKQSQVVYEFTINFK